MSVSRARALPATVAAVAALAVTFAVLPSGTAPATAGTSPRAAVTPTPSPSTTPTPPPLTPLQVMQAHLSQRSQSTLLRSHLAGIVLDRDTGQVLWSLNPSVAVMPASLTKVTTAATAYRWLGPNARMSTLVVRGRASRNVVLVGGGDPVLTSKNLTAMAVTTAAALKRANRKQITVLVDDRIFGTPTSAPGWKASYVPGEVTPIRPLLVHGRHVADTGLDAGKIFAAALTKQGVKVLTVRRGVVPKGATTLARHDSPTVASLVSWMLQVSDNQIAETLLRLSGRAAHKGGTWAGGRAARDATLVSLGAGGMTLVDGSGLSRSNRITAARYATMLRAIALNPRYRGLLNGLPVSGVSGTLARRYATAPTSCARTDVAAKTGTLQDLSGLGGFARTTTGSSKVFVFVRVGARTSARAVAAELDKLATTVVGCW